MQPAWEQQRTLALEDSRPFEKEPQALLGVRGQDKLTMADGGC